MADFLEEYTLLREIGRGGFATVYKVRHNHLGYVRAIRVLNDTVENENSPVYQKFLKECKVLLRLGNGNHPNIVHIYQPRLLANKALVEMDFVQGSDITHYLADNGNFIPADDVLRLAEQMSDALAYCHHDIYRFCMDPDYDDLQNDPDDGRRYIIGPQKEKELVDKYKVIHNDIHSGNIMCKDDGNYVLLDFGLAIEGDTVVSSSRRRNGAPEYKSPEKWENDDVLTERNDIYSFGVVLYEALAGQVPFPFDKTLGSSFKAEIKLMNDHTKTPPPPVYDLRKSYFEARFPGQTYSKDYPDWLEVAVMRCLEKDPQKRFADGKELHDFILQHKTQTVPKPTEKTPPSIELKQCPKCENWIPEKDRFCPMCGCDIEKEPENSEPLPPPPVTPVPPNPKPKKSPWRRLLQVLGLVCGAAIGRLVAAAIGRPLLVLGAVILLVLAVMILKKCRGKIVGETVATDYEIIELNGVSFNMVHVQGGTFTMGATPEQGSDVGDREKPAHQVTLSDFWIGETEVTQELWKAVMGSNLSYFNGSNLPMERVSWDDCQEFIRKLNRLTGKTFRLPTEAEWEYAARGGNRSKGYKYAGSDDINEVAWYGGNSGSKTHPVKTKDPNELGLYDMSGSVWEWCQDWYGNYIGTAQTNPNGPQSGSHRVLRGGSWRSFMGGSSRVSNRNYYNPDNRYYDRGLRLVLVH